MKLQTATIGLTVHVQGDGGGDGRGQLVVGRLARVHGRELPPLQPLQPQHVLHLSVAHALARVVHQGVLQPPGHPGRRPAWSRATTM